MPPPDVILSYAQYIVWPFALTMWMGHPILVLVLVGLTQLIMWAIAQSIGNRLDYWLGQPIVAVLSVCFAVFLQWVLPDPMRATPLRVHVVTPNSLDMDMPIASLDPEHDPAYDYDSSSNPVKDSDDVVGYFTPLPYSVETESGVTIPIGDEDGDGEYQGDIESGKVEAVAPAIPKQPSSELMGGDYRVPLSLPPPSLPPSYADRSRSFLGKIKEMFSVTAGLSHSALDRTITEMGRTSVGLGPGSVTKTASLLPFSGHNVRIEQLGQADVTPNSSKTYPLLVSLYLKERDIPAVLSGHAKVTIDEEPRRLSVYGSTRLLAPLTPGHEYLFIAAAVHLSLLVGSSVLWEHYPMPEHVWGPVSTIIAQLLGISFAWVLAIQNRALMIQPGANVFFATWLVVSIVIPAVFFLDFVDVHERWVAVIAILFAYPTAFATFTVARLIVWEANKKSVSGARITITAKHPVFRDRFVPAIDVRVKS